MNWLILLYFLELGYAPYYGTLNNSVQLQDENIFYVNMDVELVTFDYFFIGGAVKTYVNDKPGDYKFMPFESDYMFRVGFRYKNIEAGFKHFCLHPVRPMEIYYEPQGSTDASYEELYIRISN